MAWPARRRSLDVEPDSRFTATAFVLLACVAGLAMLFVAAIVAGGAR